jgi:hypothetical protein
MRNFSLMLRRWRWASKVADSSFVHPSDRVAYTGLRESPLVPVSGVDHHDWMCLFGVRLR